MWPVCHQISSSMSNLIQPCPYLSKHVQTCQNLFKLVHTCSNLSKHEKINADQFFFDKCNQLWQFWIIWQFCSLSEFWTIVTVLNICDRLDHLWQFLPMKTSVKCDFIILSIVINTDNFDYFEQYANHLAQANWEFLSKGVF